MIFLSALSVEHASAGILGGARDEVRDSSSSSSSSSGSSGGSSSSHDDDDDDDGFFGDLIFQLCFGWMDDDDDHYHHEPTNYELHEHGYRTDSVPYRLPPPELTEEYEPTLVGFAEYPYAHDYGGHFMADAPDFQPVGSTWRTWFEYGSDFDTIDRYSIDIWATFEGPIGFDADFNYYTEDLGAGASDELRIGDVNVLFRFIGNPDHMAFFGIGANWMNDSAGSEIGWNFTLRTEHFPGRPIHVTTDFDAGWLGEAEHYHANISAGIIWKQIEFTAGYDYRKIGSVSLKGPMFGLQLWY